MCRGVEFGFIQYYEWGTVLEPRSPSLCPPYLTPQEFCEYEQASESSMGPAHRDAMGPRNT